MFVKSTRFKQVCQLLLSLIVGVDQLDINEFSWRKNGNVERYEITGVIDRSVIINIFCIKTTPDC